MPYVMSVISGFIIFGLLTIIYVYLRQDRLGINKLDNKSKYRIGRVLYFTKKDMIFCSSQISKKIWMLMGTISLVSIFLIFSILNSEFYLVSKIKFIAVLIAITLSAFTDALEKKIYNEIVGSLLIFRTIMFIPEYFVYKENFIKDILSSLIAFVVCLLVFLFIHFITKGGIGMGDIKLICAIGYVEGLTCVFYMMVFGMFLSMIYAIFLLTIKKKGRKEQIPFGPFLYLGYIVVLILEMLVI